MIKKTHNILFHTLLLSVYAVFFSVQFFFNFDGPEPGNSQNIAAYSSSILHGAIGESFAKNTPTHSFAHTIRLNKRFHQEDITPCTVVSIAAPEQYVTRTTLGDFLSVFLPSSAPVHRLLRGPPVAA